MSDPTEADWRRLLIAYISHVETCEGSTFLRYTSNTLTDEERRVLLALWEAGQP